MNKILLQLLDYLTPIIKKSGADYSHVRHIVAYKLLMDGRTNALQMGQQSGSGEMSENKLIWIQILYVIFGTGIGAMGVFGADSVFWGGFMILSYAMMMSFMLMLSEFAHNLLETNDNQILLPRPVSGRTLYMARMVHIFLYLLRLNLSLVGVPFIMAFFGWGAVGAFVFLGLCVLSTIMVLAFTGMFYLAVMRFTTPDRFRRIIGSVQVFLNILFIGGYQVINQFIGRDWLHAKQYASSWWHYLAPPAWLAGLLDLAVKRQSQTPLWVLSAMAIIAPLLCMWLTNRYLTPVFTQSLGDLAVTSGSKKEKNIVSETHKSGHWLYKLAAFFNQNKAEETAFLLSWKLTTRETKFKMRAYPIIGSLLPLFFIAFKEHDPNSKIYLMLLYSVPALVFTAQLHARFSDNFKASWLFHGMPIEQPGLLLRGNSKALLLKFIVPFQVIITVVLSISFGSKILDDALLSFVGTMAVLFAESLQRSCHLPFSLDPANQEKGSQALIAVLIIIVIPVLGGLHWYATKITGGVVVCIAIMAFCVWQFYKNYEKITWQQIKT